MRNVATVNRLAIIHNIFWTEELTGTPWKNNKKNTYHALARGEKTGNGRGEKKKENAAKSHPRGTEKT